MYERNIQDDVQFPEPFSIMEKRAIQQRRDGKDCERLEESSRRKFGVYVLTRKRKGTPNFTHMELLLLILWRILNNSNDITGLDVLYDLKSGFIHRTFKIYCGVRYPVIEPYRASTTITTRKLRFLEGAGKYLILEGIRLLVDVDVLGQVIAFRNKRAVSEIKGGFRLANEDAFETLNPRSEGEVI